MSSRRTLALLAIAALLLMTFGRFGRRAALRGALGGLGAATAVRLVRRGDAVALAGAAGFAAGASQELTLLMPVLGGATAWLAVQTTRTGDGPLAAGAAVAAGVGAGLLTRRSWPVAPKEPAELRRRPPRAGVRPLRDGAGLALVVNIAAGSARQDDPVATLEGCFPAATVIPVDEGGDLRGALVAAANRAGVTAIGVAGGDGSVNTAAEVALDHGLPLVVVPAGTLNHLARDLGVVHLDDAVAAVRDGATAEIDVGDVGGALFLNTASFGVYPELVDVRERFERRIGKWPAVVVALVRVLRRAESMPVEIDGERRLVWLIFVGNCRYHPNGFAPSWRERLDDGMLDIRIVDAGQPWARTRLLLAVLSGRLGRSGVYEQLLAPSLTVRSLDGPLRPARDGETFDGPDRVTLGKRPERLCVFVPAE